MSSFASSSDHQRRYKSGISVEKGAASRRKKMVDIRRSKRSKILMAKRMKLSSATQTTTNAGANDAPMSLERGPSLATREAVLELLKDIGAAGSSKKLTHCLKRLRQFLSAPQKPPSHGESAFLDNSRDAPTHEVAMIPGAIPSLIKCLADGNDEQQLEAAWCLTNVAGGEHEDALMVIGAAPYFIAHLAGNNKPMQEQALWAIGNLAGDCQEFRERLYKNGALLPMVELFKSSKVIEIVSTSAWALSNLARGVGTPGMPFIQAGICEPLVKSLMSTQKYIDNANINDNKQLVLECCWIACTLVAKEGECVHALVSNGLLPALLVNSVYEDFKVLIPLNRALGNIFSLSRIPPEWLDCVLSDTMFLSRFRNVLLSGCSQQQFWEASHSMVKEAAWCASSMMAGNVAQKAQLSQQGIVNAMLTLMSGAISDVRNEAASAIYNYVCDPNGQGADPERVKEALSEEVLTSFVAVLTGPNIEAARVALDVLHIALSQPGGATYVERCGGMEALDNLIYMNGHDETLKEKAAFLSDTYYGDDYGLEDEEMPTDQGGIDIGTFSFPTNSQSPNRPANVPFWAQQQQAAQGLDVPGSHSHNL